MIIEAEKTGMIHLGSIQALASYYCSASNYYYNELNKTINPIKRYFLKREQKFYQYLWVNACDCIKNIQSMDKKHNIEVSDIFNIVNQIGKD